MTMCPFFFVARVCLLRICCETQCFSCSFCPHTGLELVCQDKQTNLKASIPCRTALRPLTSRASSCSAAPMWTNSSERACPHQHTAGPHPFLSLRLRPLFRRAYALSSAAQVRMCLRRRIGCESPHQHPSLRGGCGSRYGAFPLQ